MGIRASLETWAAALPSGFPAEDLARDARAVLGQLIREALAFESFPQPAPEDPTTCPSCGILATSERSPYCSVTCREITGFVRQLRGALAQESMPDEERQTSQGQVFWALIGGGYPYRVSLVPERSMGQVIAKAEGKCQACGAPATTVDHLATACNRPINLRAVCAACSRAKTFGDATVLSSARSLVAEIAGRTGAPQPLRPSDDPENWDWRAFLDQRKAMR